MNPSTTPESEEVIAFKLPFSAHRLPVFSIVSFIVLFYWFVGRDSIIRLLPYGDNIGYLYRVSSNPEILIGLLGPLLLAYAASVVLVIGEHVSISKRILIFVAALVAFTTTFFLLEFVNSEFHFARPSEA